jgi:dTDP-4-amino-4,6-dideoxygalactose transaminase
MMIQLVDLDKQYATIKNEILAKIEEVIASKAFIQGKYASEFGAVFASMHDCAYGIGCSNGTSAISLALEAAGIGDGDEVITTTHTFIATAEAICHVGATPVFVDIDPTTYTIDVTKLSACITGKTRAIVPVHLYGHPADMDGIMSMALKYDLKVIEDCAQAHCATLNGRSVGSFGDAGTFSFYPGKNLGAYGDAGAIVTNSAEMTEKTRLLLDHGRDIKYLHKIVGYNQRMDGLQAGILLVKLKYLKEWTRKRQEHAACYTDLLKGTAHLTLPTVRPNASHVYHLYVIQCNNRDKVMEHLKNKGIAASIHYPVPLHLQPAFQYLGHRKGDFPVTEHAAERVLSLPMYPELSQEEIRFICSEIKAVAR